MMALDAESGAEHDSGDEDDYAINNSSLFPTTNTPLIPTPRIAAPLGRLKFSVLLQTILQDTQTRLVFRAQAIIQSEVLHYVPNADDLDYPSKLVSSAGQGLSLWTEDETFRESEVGGFRLPREEVQVTWYPTLKRTVWVLSRLNAYVNVSPLSSLVSQHVAERWDG